jgi:SHS2 domain-containing protein
MSKPRFRVLGTTADTALLVWGKDRPQLFENAAAGLFRVMADPREIRPVVEREVHAEGVDLASLLVSWLSEWVFLFDTGGFLGRWFQVRRMRKGSMAGTGWGEVYQPDRHHLRDVVKGVTYHQLQISDVKSGIRARLVLDL